MYMFHIYIYISVFVFSNIFGLDRRGVLLFALDILGMRYETQPKETGHSTRRSGCLRSSRGRGTRYALEYINHAGCNE